MPQNFAPIPTETATEDNPLVMVPAEPAIRPVRAQDVPALLSKRIA
jgi:hypothetical protein